MTKTHKRTRLGNGENACHRRKPEHAHHIWVIDFLMDTTLSGGRLKFLTVIDEFSRSCLSIKVERSMTSYDVKGDLERHALRQNGIDAEVQPRVLLGAAERDDGAVVPL